MKKNRKILSFILALAMIFSTASLTLYSFAEDEKAVKIISDPAVSMTQGYVTKDGNANAINAKLLLDYLDSILKEKGTKIDLDLKVTKLTIDATSVNGLLKTVDLVKDASSLLKKLDGSLKKLNVSNWTKGQTRAKTGDLKVLNNFIAFINDNKALVGDVVDGSFKLGSVKVGLINVNVDKLVKDNADIDTSRLIQSLLNNDDGLYGFIKATVAKLIYDYEKDPSLKSKYDAAYKKTFDNLLLEDGLGYGLNSLLSKADEWLKGIDNEQLTPIITELYSWGFKLEGLLDGFKYNDKLTLDATLAQIADIVYTENKVYIEKLLYTYGAELQAALTSTEYGAPFASLLKFDKFTASSDYSFLDFKSTGSIKGLNDFVGQIVMGITTYTKWSGSKNLGANLEALFKWAIDNRDKTVENSPYEGYDFSGDTTKYALALAQMIVDIVVKDDAVKETLKKCTSAKEVITKLLPTILTDGGEAVVGANSTTWEQVLGDVLGHYLSKITPLYMDAGNKVRYTPGSGVSIWDVLNFAANYYLVDLNLDSLLGLSLTKSQTFLEKLDAVQAVLFGKLAYTKLSVYIPALLNDVLSLNFDGIVRTGIEEAFTDINTSVTAANLAYTMIDNVLKAVFGQSIFASSSFVSLDYIIQNKNLSTLVQNLLTGVNTRKADLLPVVLYIFVTLSNNIQFKIDILDDAAVTVKYIVYNGDNVTTGYTFTKDKDYKVTVAPNGDGSTGVVTVVGLGDYVGNVSGDSKCVRHTLNGYKVTPATCKKDGSEQLSCVCGAKTGASTTLKKGHITSLALITKSATCTEAGEKTTYCLVCGGNKKTAEIAKTGHVYGGYTVEKKASTSAAGSQYRYCKLCNKKTTSSIAKISSVKLSSTALAYNGKAQKPTVTVKDSAGKTIASSNYTVTYASGRKEIGKYTVKVTFKGTYTGTTSLSFSIVPQAPTGLKASSQTQTSLKLSWSKASGASKYIVYKSTDGKKWTKVSTVSGTSLTVKSLKAGTAYKFKVVAVDKSGKYNSADSAVLSTATQCKAPSISVSSTAKKTVKVSWKKVSGATGYTVYYSTSKTSGYKKLGTATGTSYTNNKLTSGKTYYFKVVANKKVDSKTTVNSDYSAVKSVKVK